MKGVPEQYKCCPGALLILSCLFGSYIHVCTTCIFDIHGVYVCVQAVESVMYAYPVASLPRQFPYIVLDSALRRTKNSGTVCVCVCVCVLDVCGVLCIIYM